MNPIEPQYLADRIAELEGRVNHLELKVHRPPVEDIRGWVSMCYETPTDAGRACGVSLNFIQQIMSGRRPASDKIIRQMIEDGFYGVDALKRST